MPVVEVFRHPRLAYSEDQARDDSGRFGEGSGDTKSEERTTADLTAALGEAFPNAEIVGADKLDGLPNAAALTDTLTGLARDYPEVANGVGVISFTPDPPGVAGCFTVTQDGRGSVAIDAPMLADSENINVPSDMVQTIGVGEGSGLGPGATSDEIVARYTEGVATHEFGHALDYHNVVTELGVRPTGSGKYGGMLAMSMTTTATNVDRYDRARVSSYATKNAAEAFAEGFAADQLGMSDRIGPTMREALDEAYASAERPFPSEQKDYTLITAAASDPVLGILDDFDGSIVVEYALANVPKKSAVVVELFRRVRRAYTEDQERDHGRFSGPGSGKEPRPAAVDIKSFDDMPKAQQELIEAKAAEYGITHESLRAEADACLAAASQEDNDKADAFYEGALKTCEENAPQYGLATNEYACIVAGTSPRNVWDNENTGRQPNIESANIVAGLWADNPEIGPNGERLQDMDPKEAAAACKEAGLLSPEDQPGNVMEASAANAFSGLQSYRDGGDPLPGLGGDKVRAFYEDIRTGGASPTATIDGWMTRALTGREVMTKGGPNLPANQIDSHVLGAGASGPWKEGTPTSKAREDWAPNGHVYAMFDKAVRESAAAHDPPLSTSQAQARIWYAVRSGSKTND